MAPKRRILSLWLPRLASDAALRVLGLHRGAAAGTSAGPFAVVGRRRAAEVIVCLNPTAEAAGLFRGQMLSEARALCPALVTRPEADLAPVRRALVRWAQHYSPWVGEEGADGLVLDITGVAHLFGGEEALLADLEARLVAMGFTARGAIAATRGAAWALARYGSTERAARIVPPGGEGAALAPLPVAALRLSNEITEGLARLGLARIGDLARASRAALARRFGTLLIQRWDQALGALAEPVAPAQPPAPLAVRLTLPEPVGLLADVAAVLERLLARLCRNLEEQGLGARRLRLALVRTDHSRAEAEVALARPMRKPVEIAPLFARALEALDAGFGFESFRLSAPVVEPMPPEQCAVGGAAAASELADLLTRLALRLGEGALVRFLPADSHIPERAFLITSALYGPPPAARDAWGTGPARPLMLFPPEPILQQAPAGSKPAASRPPASRPPARFRWRGRWLSVARATGPERIAPEWWLDDPAWRSGLRDYWRVDTAEGPRLWLFHAPQTGLWAVQGEFA